MAKSEWHGTGDRPIDDRRGKGTSRGVQSRATSSYNEFVQHSSSREFVRDVCRRFTGWFIRSNSVVCIVFRSYGNVSRIGSE